jgi:translation initiation factor 1
MGNNDWKQRLDIVYSTRPDFQYSYTDQEEATTLHKEKQLLRIELDKRNRGGKKVTLVTGFVGNDEDLQELGKMLKTRCGVGGSAKAGEILIQGDFRSRILTILHQEGYIKTKAIG